MIAQNHHRVVAEIGAQARAFIGIERQAFVIVIGDFPIKHLGMLRQWQKSTLEHRNRHSGAGVIMDHALDVGPRGMDRAVNDESRRMKIERRLVDNFAVEVDLDQAGGGGLIEHQSERGEQEMFLFAGYPRRYVGKDQLAPPVVICEAKKSRELDAGFPFRVADPPAHVRGVGQLAVDGFHDINSFGLGAPQSGQTPLAISS